MIKWSEMISSVIMECDRMKCDDMQFDDMQCDDMQSRGGGNAP